MILLEYVLRSLGIRGIYSNKELKNVVKKNILLTTLSENIKDLRIKPTKICKTFIGKINLKTYF